MSTAEPKAAHLATIGSAPPLEPPDHLGLPDSDGRIVENFNEHPQGQVLSDCLLDLLARKHPDGRFALGRDSGIYYRWVPDEPLAGVIVPDWMYIPDVPPNLEGHVRRSYVLWKELVPPQIVLEFASGDGTEERDRTPEAGKFWIYERKVRPAYYGIHVVGTSELELHRMVRGRFQRMKPNERGRYPIPTLGVELGIWRGWVENIHDLWMRWFDEQGNMLPSGRERVVLEAARAEAEAARAEAEAARANRLTAQLRALGITPDA